MTVYIWRATKTEPGLNGSTYATTMSKEPPAEIQLQPVPGAPGLAYSESAYSDWELVGTTAGECWLNAYGDYIVQTKGGRLYTAQEAVICGIMQRA